MPDKEDTSTMAARLLFRHFTQLRNADVQEFHSHTMLPVAVSCVNVTIKYLQVLVLELISPQAAILVQL